MPVKRLYTNQQVFPGAHVLSVDFPWTFAGNGNHQAQYHELIRALRKEVTGTWGYSSLEQTRVLDYTKGDYEKGLTWRGYLIFKDEQDVLQIKLKHDRHFKKNLIWPQHLTFTVYEFDYGT